MVAAAQCFGGESGNILEEKVDETLELAVQERAPLCTPSRARRATMIYDG